MKRMPKPLRVLLAVLTVSTTIGLSARAGSADSPAAGVSAPKAPSTAAESPRNFPWVSSSLSGTAALPPPSAERSRPAADSPASATDSEASWSGRSVARPSRGDRPQPSGETLRDIAADKSVRIREGTELKDRLAVFKPAGDRTLCFVSGMPQRMIVLENLALERVLQTLERSSVELQWSIRGVVSEYRGANYLLIQRAVVLGPTGVPRAE